MTEPRACSVCARPVGFNGKGANPHSGDIWAAGKRQRCAGTGQPPALRSWSLPPEPPAGTRLRGIVTVLRDGADHPCEYQRDTVFPDLWVEVGASHRRFTWGELLTREGPLTEVVDSE